MHMSTFSDYHKARQHAQSKAAQLDRDCGIERVNEYGKTRYSVRLLPNPGNRFGADARCEVVRPNGF